jgi:hypothetical protein
MVAPAFAIFSFPPAWSNVSAITLRHIYFFSQLCGLYFNPFKPLGVNNKDNSEANSKKNNFLGFIMLD